MDLCFDCPKITNAYHSGVWVYLFLYTLFFVGCIRKKDKEKQVFITLFLITLFVGFDLTLFPIPKSFSLTVQNTPVVNLELFRFLKEITYYQSWRVLKLTILNVALFVPFGVLIQIPHKKGWHRIFQTTLYCFLISLLFESMQYGLSLFFNSYRIFDVDDLLLNTIGGFIGAILGAFVWRFLRRITQEVKPTRRFCWSVYCLGVISILVSTFIASHIVY